MNEIYEITIIQKALEQICNEMTITLKKTAFSPNIKERMDFSCALFTSSGDLLASKEGIPVHLGSMEDAVKFMVKKFSLQKRSFFPGDIIVHNNPTEGGTHLPDINLILPIFTANQSDEPTFYASCRAHHADVGGKTPGSMPSHSETLFEEGIQIPGIKLWAKGELNQDLMEFLLFNVRTQKERKGDFFAQRSALLVGEKRVQSLIEKYSLEKLLFYIKIIMQNSSKAMEAFLTIIPANTKVSAEDYLDSDGLAQNNIKLAVTITKLKEQKILLDFTGSSEQLYANCNATKAITKSCSYYVFRYLLAFQGELATNAGLWRPLTFNLPDKSIVNASYPFATSSGNVETSQRIVDLIFKALSKVPELEMYIPAASQGTMNNITIGGINNDIFFSYYETIAGGAGASSYGNGISGVHTNMTNTLNTPVEALELSYPLRITRYELRKNSGGNGKFVGGDGLVREYEILCNHAQINMQSERRVIAPYGLYGGSDGLKGENILIDKDKQEIKLPGRFNRVLKNGEKIRIFTPGGGGFKSK